MKKLAKLIAILFIALSAISDTASAKGGGSNFMQSDGYQRALKESRQRYQRSYQPPVVVYHPVRPHHRRHWRHRHY